MLLYLRSKLRLIKRRLKMSLSSSELPWGITLLQKVSQKFCPNRLHFNKEVCYKASIVFLTYMGYMSYHLSRKPISVVKAVLHRNCSTLTPPTADAPQNWCDWAPFDGSDSMASQLLGELDSAFLFCYAAAMFLSGFIAERVNLRYFLSLGMLFSGVFSYLFGIGKTYNIHNIWYYIIVQGLAGVAQTTGWPGVVTVMSNWFGKSKRGLIFGLWNSHTSIGNILGSLIAAEYVETDWALSFIMPGLIIGVMGFILFLFLIVNPSDVGFTTTETRVDSGRVYRPVESQTTKSASGSDSEVDDSAIIIGEHATPSRYSINSENTEILRRSVNERSRLLGDSSNSSQDQAIGFLKALKIPGVAEFSLSLFYAKLVSYTFLYWLPLYVYHSTTMGATLSADMSTLFDLGGILGAIVAGVISDKTEMPATTCVGMLLFSAPMMFIYQKFSAESIGLNMVLLIVVGLLVNGPYALITTAVSAELGTHHSLEGNSKALATVTAIIDGTGSIGAAVGPLLAGFVSSYGWHNVFYMLIIADLLALLFLVRLVKHEIVKYRSHRRGLRIE
ncbi:glucose-6-phosphate exchanger SLC37A2 isoform X1 [Anthonomus grandis grandis]|uniref:glucose-6-phosphate exchanger SLC37A2 isoform X1 n=1 Tax=Anthonomus grandis grandis TaxID=2921223 RepID=UPI0021664224|nr:glucose-6-phosphate exchanger SLC37A2 isoform X1 [Anthonomus grandis grandis]XP_050302481.1 glucose-6-phosphate exchanger SLC37A2 isoform X1 [Anthonomus grandis grandis]